MLQILHGLTFGATHLGMMAALTRLAPQGSRGKAQGLFSAGMALVTASGMVASGWVYPQLGPATYLLMLPLALAGRRLCSGRRRAHASRQTSAPELALGRVNQPVVIMHGIGAILGEQQRSVEIDETGLRAEQHGRRHGQRRTQHAADEDSKAALLRLRRHGERLGEAAGLVELDIDQIIQTGEPDEAGTVMRALVRAQRNMARNVAKGLISIGLQGLFVREKNPAFGAGNRCRSCTVIDPPSLHWSARQHRLRSWRHAGPDPRDITFRRSQSPHLQDRTT